MDPKEVAALVSFLVSQIPLLLLLLFPFPFPFAHTSSTAFSHSAPQSSLLSLHLLSSASHIAAASPRRPRKRKRCQRDSEPDAAIALRRRDPDHSLLCFRMKSTTFEWLCGLLDPLLDCRDPAGSSLRLSGPIRLAIALSRLDSGAPYPELAARFGVPESTARFCTKHLCRVLCTNFRFWITFPSASELPSVSAGFQAAGGGLPDCCGALTCARFEAFGGSAIAAQIVADSSSRITHFAAGFRGDQTNFVVLKSSSLYKDVQEGKLLGPTQYLVADASYPLLPWLMIPFDDPVHGSCDENFNAWHRSMRQPAIRAVQSIKNWGVLSSLAEEENAKMAVACIGTCAILHNVLLMRDDFSTLADIDDKCHTDLEHSGKDSEFEDFVIESRASTLRSKLALSSRAAGASVQISAA